MSRAIWVGAALALGMTLSVAGCGGDDGPAGGDDAGPGDGATPMDSSTGEEDTGVGENCGDLVVDEGEECDDGNTDPDDGCSPLCLLECGDGEVTGDEACDTAIAAGEEGACPTECDDGDACTTDTLSGSECAAECIYGEIATATDGDGCCPAGADSTTDDDCDSICGNGVLEGTETCDTEIADGEPGACPTACDDGMDCTSDELVMDGTCSAACEFTDITAAVDGDMCCPSGETAATDSDCEVGCGDGVVSGTETCDTAITSGAGACPTSCDDGMACTTDELVNAGTCTAACTSTAITAPADGDGCCPAGEDISTDSDCTATCGDGVVSSGEACDTAISSGAGSCPTSCSDGVACTMDVLTGDGTCAATCSYPAITTATDGDGCCPTGETIATDDDCPRVCGDGVVTSPETCDTAISGGAGACPTACDDGDPCTVDALANDGTCRAQCTTTPVAAGPMDSCCPAGSDLSDDPDCAPACGDGIVSSGEECDDGNLVDGDGCSSTCTEEPTAFRITDLVLRDPHVFTSVLFLCPDGTSTVNGLISDGITMDGDDPPDGLLDLNIVNLFRPLDQSAASTPMEVHFADCTAPMSSTSCTPSTTAPVLSTATNMSSGTCMDLIPGTTRSSYGTITLPTAGTSGCFVSDEETINIDISGIVITLQRARIGATYSGNPATSLVNGLIRGFLSETDAEMTVIPTTISFVGGMTLAQVLRGGSGNCMSGSDVDTLSDGTTGWWFYLNFQADRVPWSEP